MSLTFISPGQAKSAFENDERRDMGVVLFESEAETWHASCPRQSYTESSVGPLDSLQTGLWISNLSYEEAMARAKNVNGVTLKFDGWMRPPVDQIMANWALTLKPPKSSVGVAATIVSRIFGLSQEVAMSYMKGRNVDRAAALRGMVNAPSLATGLMNIHRDGLLKSVPSDKSTAEMIKDTFLSGIFIPKVKKQRSIDEIELAFSFPRTSYVRRVAANRVPVSTGWQVTMRPPEMSSEEFIDLIQKTGRPAILKGICKISPADTPRWLSSFINGVLMSDGSRTRFTLEEVLLISKYTTVDVTGATLSEGWRESSTGEMIDHLVSVAGGVIPASSSYSAGCVAENILMSAGRKHRNDPDHSPEGIWMMAHDRIQMVPAIEALVDVGATFATASCGTITVNCSTEPEILMSALSVAWEHGLSLPQNTAKQIMDLGIELPVERETYYGNDVDYLFSSLAHQANKKALWSLDAVMDAAPGDRDEKSRRILPR